MSKGALLDFKQFVHWRAYLLGRPPEDVRSAEAVITAEGHHEQEETEIAQVALDGDWLCIEPQDDPGPFWSGLEEC